jgi:hypothetical protein
MVADHIRTPPVPPSRYALQAIPDGLERIVVRCLEKEPSARPSSVGALSSELQALGIEGRWTEERARGWWRPHPPAGGTEPAAPDCDIDFSRAETQSQIARMARA